ncbi:hypothetical protein ACVWYF_003451 [Hymenobacter sp. UYAg731]
MAPKELVNQLVKNKIRPAFKAAGFTIEGNTFWKGEVGFAKIFNIQNSHFNSALSASFDINIGLFFPLTYGWRLAWPLPKKPKIEHCQFGFRASALTGRHQPYAVSGETAIKQLEEIVETEVTDIIQWFASIVELEDCLTAQKQVYPPGQTCAYDVALTYAELGDLAKAKDVFKAFVTQPIGNPTERVKMNAEAKRRGLEV